MSRLPSHARPLRRTVEGTRAVLLLVLLLAASGGSPAGERPGPRIQLSPARHDFGIVKQGERPGYAFEVRNIGDEVLEVRGVRTT